MDGWPTLSQVGTKSQTTNKPSLLWKEDTKFHSRKYLIFQKTPFSSNKRPELEEEVNSLLQKRAVEKILLESPGYYSRIFLVPKKNGKMNLIIALSTLNKFVIIQSFRMETQKKVRNSVRPNNWAFSLAYLHVSIHPESRKYLRFALKDKIFQFRAL